jgi:flagellar biosynthesis protein FlhF
MKIAQMYHESRILKIGVISWRSSPNDKLRSFCAKNHFEFVQAFDDKELKKLISQMQSKQLVFIDMPAYSEYEDAVRDSAIFREIMNPLEVQLVVDAHTIEQDALNLFERLACFDPSGILFTKVDEAYSLGIMLNLSQKTGLPISYLSKGPEVSASSLEIAEPLSISKKILYQEISPNY